MHLRLRPAVPDDAPACGRICYEAFKAIGEQHNVPSAWPSPEAATEAFTAYLLHPGYYGVVAEVNGQTVGSNVLDERSAIVGLGPITVDPAVQNTAIGRQLMQHALARIAEQHRPGVRLVQAAYNASSLSLYIKLGFEVREMLVGMQGAPPVVHIPGHTVRLATEDDLAVCNQVCLQVHGHDRSGELIDAIKLATATVVEHGGRITGHVTLIGFGGHDVGESNHDVKALISAAPTFDGPGFLLSARNGELFRLCLTHGLRVVRQMTLMSRGLYNEPTGVFLASILY